MIEIQITVPVSPGDILEQLNIDDVVTHCVFRGPVQFVDTIISIVSRDPRDYSRTDARQMLARIDAFRQALEAASEKGDTFDDEGPK